MITTERTQEIIKKFGQNEKDTGSARVQIALLSERINTLRPHFEQHKHDYSSNRGLLKMIGKRRSLLRYLQKTNPQAYTQTLSDLNLRK